LLAFLTHYWVNHPENKWLAWVMGILFVIVVLMSLLGLLSALGVLPSQASLLQPVAGVWE
jgi:hypothetical protein